MIKLLALDMDGTIVNESLEISTRTMETLARVRNEFGVRVVVATGRMFPSTLVFARMLGISDPVISYQGAMVRDISVHHDEIVDYPMLFHQSIPMDVARELVDIIQTEKYHANVYVNDALYTTELNPHSVYYQNLSGIKPVEVANLHDILVMEPTKFMIIDDRADQIQHMLRERFGNRITACKSRINFCEVVHPLVSKWEALTFLMAQWDIKPEEVMACGDQENDLAMIMGAGIGVAMGNAPASIQAKADYVTGTLEEDGVVQAVERFIIQPCTNQTKDITSNSDRINA